MKHIALNLILSCLGTVCFADDVIPATTTVSGFTCGLRTETGIVTVKTTSVDGAGMAQLA